MKKVALSIIPAILLGYTLLQTQTNSLEQKVNSEQEVVRVQKTQKDKLLEKFDTWIDSTLQISKENKEYALIVNKENYTLSLIKNGEIFKQYNIELGSKPNKDKFIADSSTTPEGMYKITELLSSKKEDNKRWTDYYKALYINYPNEQDKKEFDELKLENKIKENATIGGSIEVHGKGSGLKPGQGGHNWTWGCIAISNKAMDTIYKHLEKNKPKKNYVSQITIVRYTSKKNF